MAGNRGRDSATQAPHDEAAVRTPESAPMTSPLSGLLDALGQWSIERRELAGPTGLGLPGPAQWPALPALDGVRELWAGLRNREQVRRALAPTPDDAGPLNSGALAGRMLRLMQAQSPDYLRQFTAYIDMLADLHELQARAGPTGGTAGRGSDASPVRTRAKPRRGRGAARSPVDSGR